MIGSRLAYNVMMVVAMIVAGALLKRSQRTLSLLPSQRISIALSGFIGAVVAAKLPFLLFGQATDAMIWNWLADGKTVLWGLAGGYAGVEFGKRMAGVQTRTGDTFVIPVAIGIAIGRIGCLLFGCCYGTPTTLPWGVRFETAPDLGTIDRHPTQVYEIVFHLTIAIIALVAIRFRVWQSYWMLVYLFAYCVYRFTTEFIRTEAIFLIGLTFYQCSAVVLAIIYAGIALSRYFSSTRLLTGIPE